MSDKRFYAESFCTPDKTTQVETSIEKLSNMLIRKILLVDELQNKLEKIKVLTEKHTWCSTYTACAHCRVIREVINCL